MCDPISLILGAASIFGAASNKAPPPPLPPEPVLPGREQTKTPDKVKVDVGGARAKDKARKGAITAASAKKGGSSLRTSKSSGINII